MNIEKATWYALYTKPRWEKKVADLLTKKKIVNYCPLNRVQKQWSDRKKIVLEPLFRSYVFVCIPESRQLEIRQTDGVINFVYWLGKPAHVKEEEIITIKKFLQEFTGVEVMENRLDINTKVLVKQGLLMNYKGIIVEIRGSKATVNIDSMGLELSAVFDKKNLYPV